MNSGRGLKHEEISDPDSDHIVDITNAYNKTSAVIPNGTLLGDIFCIQEKIESVNHADVYHVKVLANAALDATIDYQARAFQLDGLSPQLKAYRDRAIRRLSGRSVLRIVWRGLHVVVYKTGDPVEDGHDQAKAGVPVGSLFSLQASPKKAKIKTTRKQESDRLRQKSRRQRKREREQVAESPGNNSEPLGEPAQDRSPAGSTIPMKVNENDFVFFEMLQLLNDPKAQQKLSSSAKLAVEGYLAAKDKQVTLEDEDALADLIAIKEREIVYLRRQHNKFTPVIENWTVYLRDVWPSNGENIRRLISSVNYSEQLQQKMAFVNRWGILKPGFDALPHLIAASEDKVRVMKTKLAASRQAREERDMRQTAKHEQKRLTKRIKNYRNWIHEVIPGTALYADMVRELESVEEQLRKMNG
ncbi:hypothetical protein ACHAPJ_008624 [Fusarium lateritium]